MYDESVMVLEKRVWAIRFFTNVFSGFFPGTLSLFELLFDDAAGNDYSNY